MQCGDRLGLYLSKIAILHVMSLDEVNIIHAEASQTLFHAPQYTFGGEIELRVPVASNFGREYIAIPRYAAQCFAEHCLGAGVAIKRRNIDEPDTVIECKVYGANCVLFRDRAVDAAPK
jgi:hypothetical protein